MILWTHVEATHHITHASMLPHQGGVRSNSNNGRLGVIQRGNTISIINFSRPNTPCLSSLKNIIDFINLAHLI